MKQNVIQLKKMSMETSVPIHQSAHLYVNQEKFHALPVRMKTVAKNQRFVSSKKEIMTVIYAQHIAQLSVLITKSCVKATLMKRDANSRHMRPQRTEN
jgi:hypothetical protein